MVNTFKHGSFYSYINAFAYGVLDKIGGRTSVRYFQVAFTNSWDDAVYQHQVDSFYAEFQELVDQGKLTQRQVDALLEWDAHQVYPIRPSKIYNMEVRTVVRAWYNYFRTGTLFWASAPYHKEISYQHAISLRNEWKRSKDIYADCRTYEGQPNRNMVFA